MGMGFLDTLPAPLTARSRRFFSVWHGWRGDRLLPERRDIDHAALGELPETCLLLNVRGHADILVEWVARTVTDPLGANLTGFYYLHPTTKATHHGRAQCREKGC